MTKTSISVTRWTYYGIIACAVLSLVSLAYRYSAEKSNRAVALATEIESVEALGLAEGMTLPKAMKTLSASGINAVVLSEESVGDLVTAGQLKIDITPTNLLVSGDKVQPDANHAIFVLENSRQPSQGEHIRHGRHAEAVQ